MEHPDGSPSSRPTQRRAPGAAMGAVSEVGTHDPSLLLRCVGDGSVTAVLDDRVGTGVRVGDVVGDLAVPRQSAALQALVHRVARDHTPAAAWIAFGGVAGGSHVLQVVGMMDHVAGPPATPDVVVAAAADPLALERLLQAWADGPDDVLSLLQRAMARSDPLPDPQSGRSGSSDSLMAGVLTASIAELRELVATMGDQVESQRRLAEDRAEVLAAVAHDLRSPLGSIVGFAELLRPRLAGRLDDDERLCLERIEAQGHRLLRLADDLVDASTIDEGAVRLDLEDVLLADLLAEAVALYAPTAQQKGISVSLAGPEPAAVGTLDRARFHRVLDNLLSNAIKFSAAHVGARIRVGGEIEDGAVHVTVEDEGVGIEPERFDRLFDRFTVTHTPGTEGERGSGLGLAITAALVRAHGGGLTLSSEPECGTRVIVRIPRSGPASSDPSDG